MTTSAAGVPLTVSRICVLSPFISAPFFAAVVMLAAARPRFETNCAALSSLLPAEALDEEVDEEPHLHRQMPRRRIDRVERKRRRRIVGQDSAERAGLQGVLGDEARDQRHALALDRDVAQHLGVVVVVCFGWLFFLVAVGAGVFLL